MSEIGIINENSFIQDPQKGDVNGGDNNNHQGNGSQQEGGGQKYVDNNSQQQGTGGDNSDNGNAINDSVIINYLKEKYGLPYDKLEDLKADISFKEKYNDLSTKLVEYETKNKEYESKLKNIDLKNIFADDYVQKLNDIRKKYPDIDPTIAIRIMNTDLTKSDKLSVIVLNERLKNPDLDVSDNDIIEGLIPDIPEDVNDWDGKIKYKISSLYRDAKENIEKIKNSANEVTDINTLIEQKTKEEENLIKEINIKNEPIVKNLLNNFVNTGINFEFKIGDGEAINLKHEIDKKFIFEEYYNEVMGDLADIKLALDSEDAKEDAKRTFFQDYVGRNFDKIIKDFGQSIVTEMGKLYHLKLHNPQTPGGGNNQSNNNSGYSEELSNAIRGSRFQW